MHVLRRLGKFVQKITIGLRGCDRRFVRESLFGISLRREVMLSEIGRALRDPASIHKVEDRLSRMASTPHFDDEKLQDNFLKTVGPLTRRLKVVAVDLSDIQKPYAKHMELLKTVRDGSTGELGPGYWLFEVTATDEQHHTLPLMTELFSTAHADFESQPKQVRLYLEKVQPHVHPEALWACDRGFDGDSYLRTLDNLALHWIVRQRGNRHIEIGGRSWLMKTLAAGLELKHSTLVQSIRKRRVRQHRVLFTYVPVHLPDVTDRPLGLIVCRREDFANPMMLLCWEMPKSDRDAEAIVQAYARRWSVEDSARGIKQLTNLENIRVMSYVALQRIVRLAGMAMAWMTVLLLTAKKTAQYLLSHAQAFGPAHFQLYQLSEGLRATLGV